MRGIGRPLERHRFAVALGAIALVALALRIVFVVVVAPTVPKLGDANAYHLLADQLARGLGYIRPFDNLLLHLHRPTAEYPPLFALLLSVSTRLGADTVEQQRIFLSFVGAGTVVLVGLLGRRVASGAVGLAAAALAAVYPMLFLPEATLMSEIFPRVRVPPLVGTSFAAAEGDAKPEPEVPLLPLLSSSPQPTRASPAAPEARAMPPPSRRRRVTGASPRWFMLEFLCR